MCCNPNEVFRAPHPFLSALSFFPTASAYLFFSILDSRRTDEKEDADGGRKKNERGEKDEKQEKQFNFFCATISLVPAGIGDRY